MRKRVLFAGFLVGLLAMAGCRNVYYSTWEKLGKHKRDLLQSKVRDVRDEQKEASQDLKDALTRLKELTGFQGGELEKTYKKLQSDYDTAAKIQIDISKLIEEMNASIRQADEFLKQSK